MNFRKNYDDFKLIADYTHSFFLCYSSMLARHHVEWNADSLKIIFNIFP